MIKRELVGGLLVACFSTLGAFAQQQQPQTGGGQQQQPAQQQQQGGNQAAAAAASGSGNKYLEYTYGKLAVKERKAIPYPSLREADVSYAKRIERIVDVREKKNLPLKWPKNPLWKVMQDNIYKGEDNGYGKLKAYISDSLESVYTIGDIKKRGGQTLSVEYAPNPDNPDYTVTKDTVQSFDWSKITRYVIKEEWIFDKQRSQFFPRIIAFAPLFKMSINGVELPEQQLCWINYNEFRTKIGMQEEIFNRNNDAMRLTYSDFFENRLFSSYITKESNEFDAAIRELPEFKDDPMGALYESERIKDNLFNWEHDLWEY